MDGHLKTLKNLSARKRYARQLVETELAPFSFDEKKNILNNRTRTYILKRANIIFKLREMGFSLPVIGYALGKNHSSISNILESPRWKRLTD